MRSKREMINRVNSEVTLIRNRLLQLQAEQESHQSAVMKGVLAGRLEALTECGKMLEGKPDTIDLLH